MMKLAIVVGGVGKKVSNGGKQFYMQDRVYYGDIAVSIPTGFHPYYLLERKTQYDKRTEKII